LKKNGIPESQIIHLAQDDIANSHQNPIKGKLFNRGGSDPLEVYEGCKIDYTGADVTAETVQAVLKGDAKTAGGPVLETDADSKVFFYFADHGAPGLVAMPNGPYLYADDFHKTLLEMNEKKMYKEMTVYIEACESGSMFENILEDDLNIYAVSAANSSESSWGTYCSAPENQVDGKYLNTCLGDLFSVNWLEDSDKGKIGVETLQDQYNVVKKETAKSHVLQWGDVSLAEEPVADFQSGQDVEKVSFWKKLGNFGKQAYLENAPWVQKFADLKAAGSVDSRDVKLHYLYNLVK